MIPVPTSCRERLQPRDFEFITRVLAGGDRGATFLAELFGEADSLAVVLDQDKLPRAVLELPAPLSISPELYFYVIVRRSLKDAGIDDLEIADYVATTLAHHARGGHHSASRGGDRPEAEFTYHLDFIEKMTDSSSTGALFPRGAVRQPFPRPDGSLPPLPDTPGGAARRSRARLLRGRGAPGFSHRRPPPARG